MTESKARISDGYLESYAEIPDDYIEDDYLAIKKLRWHRRLFQPGDLESELAWCNEHREELERAYGKERLERFLEGISPDNSRPG